MKKTIEPLAKEVARDGKAKEKKDRLEAMKKIEAHLEAGKQVLGRQLEDGRREEVEAGMRWREEGVSWRGVGVGGRVSVARGKGETSLK